MKGDPYRCDQELMEYMVLIRLFAFWAASCSHASSLCVLDCIYFSRDCIKLLVCHLPVSLIVDYGVALAALPLLANCSNEEPDVIVVAEVA
ncbi:hypothetical protein Nepgr_022864 [Nepenthes gracilis]|uniref:Uncharacterized protein n=1 Tax=Nepenthes gracilis TaxID=150966 RepID=A0AAD3T1N2_NEPGR|nr:hypothetical protein Nepgr_022864 [Nepenthes gracilis]